MFWSGSSSKEGRGGDGMGSGYKFLYLFQICRVCHGHLGLICGATTDGGSFRHTRLSLDVVKASPALPG